MRFLHRRSHLCSPPTSLLHCLEVANAKVLILFGGAEPASLLVLTCPVYLSLRSGWVGLASLLMGEKVTVAPVGSSQRCRGEDAFLDQARVWGRRDLSETPSLYPTLLGTFLQHWTLHLRSFGLVSPAHASGCRR